MRDPFSLEAEQAVLGAMMKAPEMIDLLATDISAKDFYWQDNADVFKAIMELNSLNRNIDFLTVGEHIGNLDNGNGGPAFAYCAEIQNGTPSTANAEQYARIARERSMDRALIAMAQDIHDIAIKARSIDRSRGLRLKFSGWMLRRRPMTLCRCLIHLLSTWMFWKSD